jgi:hypothetical protein
MNIIANHRYFTDDIATYIKYPGDAAKKITVEDPDSNELIDLISLAILVLELVL